MRERCRPFDTGTQFADWKARNCARCKKRYRDEQWHCDIEDNLDYACLTNGLIDVKIAKRMGYQDNAYNWDCLEREEE